MVGKREMSEDVYGMVLQRLRDRVRAGLPKSQCPGVELHTRWEHVCTPDAIGMYGIEEDVSKLWIPSQRERPNS
jgi:hypothetical protein